jgi:hypothetical protein
MVEPSADTADARPGPLLGRVVVRAPTHSRKSRVQTRRTRTRNARTPTRDTGRPHPTLDSGRVDTRMRGHRALDTGRADAGHAPDTGHWTGGRWTRGCGQGDQGHGGHPDILGTTTPLGRRTVLLWAAHAALGKHDGLAVRPPASAGLPLHYQAAARSLRQRPSRASAHCSPRTITGRA